MPDENSGSKEKGDKDLKTDIELEDMLAAEVNKKESKVEKEPNKSDGTQSQSQSDSDKG